MSNKVGNIIAIELGVIIALAAWFAFAGFPGNRQKQPLAATAEERPIDSFATVTRNVRPRAQQIPARSFYSDGEETQPIVYQEPLQAASAIYEPDSMAETYPQNEPQATEFADDPQNSIGLYPEPVLDAYDYYGTPYTPYYSYSQPVQNYIVSSVYVAGSRRRAARRQNQRIAFAAPRQHQPRSVPRRTVNPPRANGNTNVRGGGGSSARVSRPKRPSRPAQNVSRSSRPKTQWQP